MSTTVKVVRGSLSRALKTQCRWSLDHRHPLASGPSNKDSAGSIKWTWSHVMIWCVSSGRDAEMQRKVFEFKLKFQICNEVLYERIDPVQVSSLWQIGLARSNAGRGPWLSFGWAGTAASQSCFQPDVSSWKFSEENDWKKGAFFWEWWRDVN